MSTLYSKAETQYVLGNAIVVLCAGLLFVFFSIQFMGIDLLIDAVGWVLIFNGIRILERPGGGIGPKAALCIVLAVAGGALLFLKGMLYTVVVYGYAILSALFFIALAFLLHRILLILHHRISAICCAVCFGIMALLFPFLALSPVVGFHFIALSIVGFFVKLLSLGLLFWVWRLFHKNKSNA